jgi:tetraacyldisaccharide 4'-kinase
VLVLDDGFQHRRLGRDLDIVLVDATCPWGLGCVLPRGLLREPLSGLGRADAVLLTRCDQVEAGQRRQILERVRRLAPKAVIAAASHQPVELINAEGQSNPTALIRARPCAAFCGIGNPEGFRRTVLDLGGDLRDWRTYPDHHPYTRSDVQDLQDWASALPEEAVILTTQKDLVKLRLVELAGRPLWAVRVRLAVLENEEALQALLRAKGMRDEG